MSDVFTPVVDAEEVYGESDYRPILGAGPRKDSWKLYMIGKQSIEHKLRGIIYPSLDFTLSLSDKAFPASVGRVWTDQADKHLPRHFVPNAFALPILMYPYLGENKEHWVSPANRRNMIGNDTTDPEEFADAFDDLNKWVRRNKQFSQAQKDGFLKGKSMQDDPPIPGRTIRYFSLGECMDKENDWHLAVAGYTASAYSYLIEQLRWLHQDQGEARDPNWPNYMIGDATDPAGAVEWHVDKVLLDPKDNYESNVLCFTERREFLDDPQKVRKISEESLLKRFCMADPENWNIATYEEQVHHMMLHFDISVTADMIRAACGHRCRVDIPHERPESVRLQATAGGSPDEAPQKRERPGRESEPAGDPMAAVTGGMAPKSTAPMPQDEPNREVAATTPDTEATYWAGKGGEKPVKFPVSKLQELANKGLHEGFKVNMDAKKDWQPLETCGLVTIPTVEESPPPVPEDEAPPAVPEDDTPPEVPTSATPAEGAITLEAMKSKLFPDPAAFAELNQAQQSAAEALVVKAWEATEHGTKRDMPADIVEELMIIMGAA